jgi:hypothetical protein
LNKKKPSPLVRFDVPIPLYHSSVHFIVTKDIQRAKKLVERWFEGDCEEWGAGVQGRTLFKPGYASVIWLPSFPKTINEYGSLIHETAHATFVLLRSRGLGFTLESEEAFTYLQEYLASEFLRKAKKINGKKH